MHLRQAFLEYTTAAIRELEGVCTKEAARVLRGLDEWRRDTDGVFRLYDREQPYWVNCIHIQKDRIHSLPQYDRLISILRSDPDISPLINTLVGTSNSARRVELDELADHFLFAIPQEIDDLKFDEGAFDRILSQFERDLRRSSYQYILLVPLLGLSMEQAPVLLDTDTEIDEMTDKEITRCLQVNLLPDEIGLQRMRFPKKEFALRVRYEIDRRIGEQSPMPTPPHSQQIAVERALAVLKAFRVFKEGVITISGLLHYSTNWPLTGSSHFTFSNPGPMPWANKYILTPEESLTLAAFWRQFDQVTQRGALAYAVRRFSYASERERPEDRLIDLMISAESLFLSDTGGTPEDKGELKYRLSLRAAFFIESTDSSRREIYRHMKRAYDARSAIVHGSEPQPRLLKSLKDEQISIHQFAKITERLVRRALQKAISMAKAGSGFQVDWDALIIPEGNSCEAQSAPKD